MSSHRVDVVRLGPIEKHPNADTLGIVEIWAYTAIVRLGEFNEGDLVAYVEPDYVVPETEQFAFLKDRRIRARRLRGVWSQGLVIAAPEGSGEGDDVMEALGVVRYEPPTRRAGGWNGPGNYDGPNMSGAEAPHKSLETLPKYDLENLRRYHRSLVEGETVYVSEKIHGANARFAWRDGRMWFGSRTQWKDTSLTSWWSRAVELDPWIVDWCRHNQDCVLYGEVYGTQDLAYGLPSTDVRFLAFDIRRDDRWVNVDEFLQELDPKCRVPGWIDTFHVVRLGEVSRSDSWLCPGQVAEGIVVKPMVERFDRNVGRVALKLVSDRYLERAR